jgi:hypothetical protein
MAYFGFTDYWLFEHSLRTKFRHVLEDDARQFLNNLVSTIGDDRKSSLSKGTVLWRAQRRHAVKSIDTADGQADVACPHEEKRMLPLPYRATEGRANPKGIPYLYVASDEKTAMSEMRPWVGDYLSVAEIKIVSDLILVDCSKSEFPEPRLGPLRPYSFESEIWGFVNAAFSTPVTPDDDIADYAPTQAIAESFRGAGYRGVKYRSSVGDGSNFVLFDLSDVEVGPRSLHRTTKACYSFEVSEGPDLSHEKFLDELHATRSRRRS